VISPHRLDEARFEAFLSFIQSLTEVAKMVPCVLIVGSLPRATRRPAARAAVKRCCG
jgi:hypothetical protein